MKIRATIIITACPSQSEADQLATALIERKLAACVQASQIASTYHWKGKVERESEVRLLIKTNDSLFDMVSSCIREVLSYENPEILSIPVTKGSSEYLDWISEETSDE